MVHLWSVNFGLKSTRNDGAPFNDRDPESKKFDGTIIKTVVGVPTSSECPENTAASEMVATDIHLAITYLIQCL